MESVRRLNILIDINLILDVLLARDPWVDEARAVWTAHHEGRIVGHIAAHGVANVYYIARKLIGFERAREAVRLCLQTFEILTVGRPELELADRYPGNDIEDNLVLACASIAGLDVIVTRDPRGFAGSSTTILSPGELLSRLAKPDSP